MTLGGDMPAIHHLKLFGVPHLLDGGGQRVGLRTRKQLGLLVYLALEARDHPVPRDALMNLFWNGVSRERADHSLSQALTAIRDRLGRDAFSNSALGVRLSRGLTTDLDSPATRDLDPKDIAKPLEGLEACGGPEFAHWVDRTREACRRQLHTQLMADLTTARTVGSLVEVHRAAALLYAVDPHSDTAALALAEQYLLEGDSTGAIRLLRDHNNRLGNELGRDPPRQITLLLRRLEAGYMPQRPAAEQLEEGDRPTLARDEVFVGRERELSRLEAAWTAACRGNLAKCLVSGEDGIGKSALVRRFATSVSARAWPAYLVACQKIGRGIPFAMVSDLVYQLMRDPALSGTDPAWLAEASRVTPGLRALYPGVPEASAAPADAVRLRVADALSHMLAAVADDGPLLLVLDHLQNIDPASRDVIHLLTVRLEQTPTLLLATMTSSDREFILSGPGAVGGVEWPTSIELEPLEPRQICQLIEHFDPELGESHPEVYGRIVEFALGNPYLSEMLLSDWRINGPESLVARDTSVSSGNGPWHPPVTMRLAFERQYKGVSHDAQRLVDLLAVAGRSIALIDLESLLGIPATDLDKAALELIERALIRTVGGALGFKNELHRLFIYWAMSDEARTYHHGRLARSLTASAKEDDFQRGLEAAHHYLKAGMSEKAVETVCMGAELAVMRGAPQEAEKALKAVIELGDSELTRHPIVLLSAALSAQQRYRESLRNLEETRIDRCDMRYRAMATNLRAEALHRGRMTDPDTMSRIAHEAVIAAAEVKDQRLELGALQVMSEVAYARGDWHTLGEARRCAEGIGRDSDSIEVKALACLTLGYCCLVSGDYEGAAEKLAYSCQKLESLRHYSKLHWALNGLGMCYTDLGLFRRAEATLRQAMSVAHGCGDQVAHANSCANLGSLYYELGMFSKSAEAFRKAASLDTQETNTLVSAALRCNAANLAIALGNFTEAEFLLEKACEAAERSRLWPQNVSIILTWADLALARGQPEIAWSRVEEALALASLHRQPVPDAGQFWRLRMHYEWATRGPKSGHARRITWRPALVPRLTHSLEVRAFEEWIAIGDRPLEGADRPALDHLVEHRLFGIIARLAAIHIFPASLPARLRDESAAALIARAFPIRVYQDIPSCVGIKESH